MANERHVDVEGIRRVDKLCQLGARPPVIKALLPAFKEGVISSQWEYVRKTRPPKGRLPLLPEWFLSNYQIKLEASYVANVWRKANDARTNRVDALIAAYERYLEVFPEPKMNFDRVWYLITVLNNRTLIQVRCPECGSKYIHFTESLVNHKTCPVCKVFNLTLKRVRIAKQGSQQSNSVAMDHQTMIPLMHSLFQSGPRKQEQPKASQ